MFHFAKHTALVTLLSAPLLAQWGPAITAQPPSPRSGAMMAFDHLNNRTLMFGGNWSNEMWSLSAGVWTQLFPTTLPGSRSRAAMSTNVITGEILLYGGDDPSGQNALDETWLWNGTDWQQRTSLHSPSGLARHGMAFDMVRQTTVVFGGRRNSWQPHVTANETWEWDHALGAWNPVLPVNSPPGLMDPAMGYHLGLSKVVLFGGENGNGDGSGETWTYDGTTWQLVPPVGPQPPARVGARLVEILNRATCLLVGGYDPVTMVIPNDTWEFDGVTWTKIDNVYGGVYPPRTSFAVVHDFGRDRMVLFGGKAANTALLGDTWEFGGQFSKFGMGCAGSAGVPTLTPTGLPKFGATASTTLSNLEPNAAFAVLIAGFSRTQWLGGSLPSLLTGIGMPGCRLYVSPDILIGLGASGGQATWNYAVPYQPSDLGDTFYLQGLSLDAGVNAASMTVSNATTMVIGY